MGDVNRDTGSGENTDSDKNTSSEIWGGLSSDTCTHGGSGLIPDTGDKVPDGEDKAPTTDTQGGSGLIPDNGDENPDEGGNNSGLGGDNTDGGADTPHTHEYTVWVVREKPTCTNSGKQEGFCECGYSKIRPIPAEGHSTVEVEAKAPTCYEVGYTEGKKCTRCNIFVEGHKTLDLSHSFKDGKCESCGQAQYTEGVEYTLYKGNEYCVSGIKSDCTDETIVIRPYYTPEGSDSAYPVTYIKSVYSPTAKEIIIPEGVEEIKQSAFRGLSTLESIHIPSTVRVIKEDTFVECKEIKEVHIADVKSWCEINSAYPWVYPIFSNIYGYDMYVNGELLEDLYLGSDIRWVYSYAFSGCDSIKSVTVLGGEDNYMQIGEYAFSYCRGILKVDLDRASLSKNVFFMCPNLMSARIGDDVNLNGGNGGVFFGMRLLEVFTSYTGKILEGYEDYWEGGAEKFVRVINNDLSAPSAIITDENGFVFLKDGNTYLLINYLGYDSTVVLPTDINGHEYTVTTRFLIGGALNVRVSSVIIPEVIFIEKGTYSSWGGSYDIFFEAEIKHAGIVDAWDGEKVVWGYKAD